MVTKSVSVSVVVIMTGCVCTTMDVVGMHKFFVVLVVEALDCTDEEVSDSIVSVVSLSCLNTVQ